MPVGAMTVVCALRKPNFSPKPSASSQHATERDSRSAAFERLMRPAFTTEWSIGTGRMRRFSHSSLPRDTPIAARRWLRTTRSMLSRFSP